jgi:hypothetical protein
VYHVEKGNTNGLLKSMWHTMNKKEKVTKIFEDMGVLILFVSKELRTIKGDTLGELVKCKSSKNIFQTNFSENRTYPPFFTRF